MPPWMGCQPPFDFRMLVRGIVVDDDVHVEFLGNILLNVFEELEILLVPVLALALGKNFTGRNVEGCKERRRPVPFIVVRDAFDIPQSHGKHGLRTLKSLDLALFINAENDGVLWRTNVQTNNIPDFFDKERIGRDLEMLLPVRL